MPTPFSHLQTIHSLLNDPVVPQETRHFLDAHRSAYLLGAVAADARADGTKREDTHFYSYTSPIIEHPWRVMMEKYPQLQAADSAAHRAFLAGYIAHLSMDEIWTKHMLAEHFVRREWGESRQWRFVMLHILLIYMDERDVERIPQATPDRLRAAEPHDWLPFLPDDTLREWRDFMAQQLTEETQTLEIFGGRINWTPAELRAVLDDPTVMQRDLWQHVTPTILAEIEAQMTDHARQQMQVYLDEYPVKMR